MNVITGGHGYGRTEFLIQWIQGLRHKNYNIIVITEDQKKEIEFNQRLPLPMVLGATVTVESIMGFSWCAIVTSSRKLLHNFDIVILDTDLSHTGQEFCGLMKELSTYSNMIIVTAVKDGFRLDLNSFPGFCSDAIDQSTFNQIEPSVHNAVTRSLSSVGITPLQPISQPITGKSTSSAVGQAMQNLFQQVSAINKNVFNEEYDSCYARLKQNLIIDDLTDDSTITIGNHTMTKVELIDMVTWWQK